MNRNTYQNGAYYRIKIKYGYYAGEYDAECSTEDGETLFYIPDPDEEDNGQHLGLLGFNLNDRELEVLNRVD